MQEVAVAGRHHHGSGSRVGRTLLTLGAGMLLGIVLTLQMLSYMRITTGNGRVQLPPGPVETLIQQDDLGMADAELLRRATLPVSRTPKVAFMFLTVGPLPLAPLWERFFQGGRRNQYSIYIHSLPDYEPSYPSSSVFFKRHVASQPTKWGEISMCDAERRLLANALLDPDNARFILLSESCAPLRNFTFTYGYLLNSAQSFVGVFDDPSPVGRGRYDARMLPEVAIEQWRKGAQWFEVSRELATYVVADVKYYPKFRRFCQPVCYVDEHYIPTMLWIEFGKAEVAMRSVTAVDWTRGGAHPGEFGKEDAVEFYRRIRGDEGCVYNGEPGHPCYMFARKFMPDSLESLLAIQ